MTLKSLNSTIPNTLIEKGVNGKWEALIIFRITNNRMYIIYKYLNPTICNKEIRKHYICNVSLNTGQSKKKKREEDGRLITYQHLDQLHKCPGACRDQLH